MVAQLAPPAAPIHDRPRRMSYEEFVVWAGDDVVAEWVDGEVIVFMPQGVDHIRIIAFVLNLLDDFVRYHRLGEVYGEPFEQRTRRGRAARRPDAVFVATEHLARFTASGFEGAVDLVVEVVSADSATRDRRDKWREYAEAGIPEYWVVEGREDRHGVAFFELMPDGYYRDIPPDANGRLYSRVLPGFWLDLAWLAGERLPDRDWVMDQLVPGHLLERAKRLHGA
jgi:Uma2 family endonuclease